MHEIYSDTKQVHWNNVKDMNPSRMSVLEKIGATFPFNEISLIRKNVELHFKRIKKIKLTWNPAGSGSCCTVSLISSHGLNSSITASWWVAWVTSDPLTFKIRSPILNFPDKAAMPPGTIWNFKCIKSILRWQQFCSNQVALELRGSRQARNWNFSWTNFMDNVKPVKSYLKTAKKII